MKNKYFIQNLGNRYSGLKDLYLCIDEKSVFWSSSPYRNESFCKYWIFAKILQILIFVFEKEKTRLVKSEKLEDQR